MKRKNSLTKKEKIYVGVGILVVIIILVILGSIVFNKVFSGKDTKGRIQMTLSDKKITTGEETNLVITVKNTGKTLLEGKLEVKPDDITAVIITHPDETVLNLKLYPEESVTRVFNVKGTTTAIRTDYKIFAEIKKENETLSSNEVILTVTQE